MQPSGPNRPIELPSITTATLIARSAPHAAPSRASSATLTQSINQSQTATPSEKGPARWPGGYRGDDTPDPIPNSDVKHPSAYGTASQDAGESVAAGPPRRTHTSDPTPPPRGGAAR